MQKVIVAQGQKRKLPESVYSIEPLAPKVVEDIGCPIFVYLSLK